MSRQHDSEALAATHKTTKARPKPAPEPQPGEDLRSSVGNSGMGTLIGTSVTDTIEAEMGAGKPLSDTPGARAAKGDGEDVRIHDDGTAADLNRELGSVAFTFGRDIFLSGHAPDLDSSDGRAMLRHELTHVEQQAEGGTTRPRRVSSPDSPAEQQAARAQHGDAGAKTAAGAGAVHRQEEEEEMMMPMRETVHRQEEQEEEGALQMMRAETVHRQEEEEEMMMPMRETVHRQEEEEEMMMPMRETVHRQEEEEEMMMPMRETVHRQVAVEPVEIEARQMANPALAAVFDTNVVAKIDEALVHMEADPSDPEAAMRALNVASDTMHALAGSYRASDPLLAANLNAARNAAISLTTAIAPMAGVGPDVDYIRNGLDGLMTRTNDLTPSLH